MNISAGWKSPYGGTLYKVDDPRLTGYGYPPSDPAFHADPKNKGLGRSIMEGVTLELDSDGNITGESQPF